MQLKTCMMIRVVVLLRQGSVTDRDLVVITVVMRFRLRVAQNAESKAE